MTTELEQEPHEPIFGPVLAKFWLVQTGRAAETDGHLKVHMPLDRLGQAALGIMAGEQPPVLSQAYERVAEVAALSRDFISGIVQGAIEDSAAARAEKA